MSKLGNLFYDIQFKDGTANGIKSIADKIKSLNSKLAIGVDEKQIVQSIQGALNRTFEIKVNAKVSGLESISKQIESVASKAASAVSSAASKSTSSKKDAQRELEFSLNEKAYKNRTRFREQDRKAQEREDERQRRELVRQQKAILSGEQEKFKLIAKAEDARAKIREANKKAEEKYLRAQQNEDPFGRHLRRVFVAPQVNKDAIRTLNEAIDKKRAEIANLNRVGSNKEFGKHLVNGVATWKAGRERQYNDALSDLKSLMHTRSKFYDAKSVISVTDLPKKGSAAFGVEMERRKARIADSKAAYTEYFRKKKEEENAARARAKEEERAARVRARENEKAARYASSEAKSLSLAKKSVDLAVSQSKELSKAVPSTDKIRLAAVNSYSVGMGKISRLTSKSLSEAVAGRTPPISSKYVADEVRQMEAWMKQFNAIDAARRSIINQKRQLSQMVSNNPSRASDVGVEIKKLNSYKNELYKAQKTLASAMRGDSEARGRLLLRGAYSSDWLNQIQRNAKAAGDAISRSFSGMQATNYASNLRQVADELANVQSRGSRVAEVLGGVFSVYAAKEFFDKLVQIGGEFEKQKLALAAMFNSQTRADTIYSQIQALAVKSPFTFGELTSYSKQLTAYGIQYKDIYDTTKRLADISAGVGVPMSRIILAYGQVSTAKFLRGQELRQFTEAGIPLVEALANRFTKLKGEMVTADDVFKMISERAVKFEDVKAVLDEMTNKGGRFYEMQNVLSESLSGKWSNLQDSIEIMFSEIEGSNKGFLKGIVESMTNVVRNWRYLVDIGSALLFVYGALIARQKVGYLLNVKTSAINAKIIADANARVAAIERETAAFNAQTAAIGKNSSAKEIGALRRMGYSLAINGANSDKILNMVPYAYPKERQRRWIKWIGGVNNDKSKLINEINKSSKIEFGKRFKVMGQNAKLAFARATLAASTFGATMRSLITLPNLLMVGISIAIGVWQHFSQKAAAMNEHVRESIKGMQDSYKELSQFVKEHPIEATIKSGNESAIHELMKAYKQEVENAPIDLSYVIKNASAIEDVGNRLRYMQNELVGFAHVVKQYERIAGATTRNIDDTTDGLFDESLAENIKDYVNSKSKLEAMYASMTKNDVEEMFNRLQSGSVRFLMGKSDEFIADYKKTLARMKEAMDENDIFSYYEEMESFNNRHGDKPYFNVNDGNSKLVYARADVKNDYITMANDIESAMPLIEAALNKGHEQIVKANGEIVEKEKFMLSNLTDQGHQALVSILQDYVTQGKISKMEMEEWLSYIESNKAKASSNATWQTNTKAFNAFMERLKNRYKKDFEGKEFTGQFSKMQQQSFSEAIDSLPSDLQPYKNKLREQLAKMSNELKLVIAVELNMTGSNGDELAPTEAQDLFNSIAHKGRSKADSWKRLSAAYAPTRDESTLSWMDRLAKSVKESDEKYIRYKGMKIRDTSVEKNQEDAYNARKQALGILWEINPDYARDVEESLESSKKKKKSDKKQKDTENKADKAERDRLKKLRERISRLNDFKQMYEKYIAVYGEVEGMKKLLDSGIYAANFVPKGLIGRDNVSKWVSVEQGKIHNEAGRKTEDQRNVGEQALKAKIDLDVEIDKRSLDKELKDLERQLKKTHEKWEKYTMFREVGLSQEQSVMLSFGDGRTPMTEAEERKQQLLDFIKKNNLTPINIERLLEMDEDEIKSFFGEDSKFVRPITKMVDAYKEAWKKIADDNNQMYKQMIENAKGYDEKLADINAKYDKQDKAIKQGVASYEKTGGKEGISPEVATRMMASNRQERDKSIGVLQMDEMRKGENYMRFFNAISAMTIDEATKIGNSIRTELSQKLREGTISAKDYAEEIEKINGQMDKIRGLQSKSEATWNGGLSGRIKWEKENAQDSWNMANDSHAAAQLKYNEAEKKGDYASMREAEETMGESSKAMAEAKEILSKVSEREERQKKVTNAINKLSSSVSSLSSFRDALGNTIESFGGDTTRSGFQTFSAVVDSLSALASSTQSIMQGVMNGDFVGAAFSAITAPLNVITVFNKLHDQKLQRQIEQSEKRSAEIKNAADRIQNAIENSLGTEAAKNSSIIAYKRLSEQFAAAGVKEFSKSYSRIYEALENPDSVRSYISELSKKSSDSKELLEWVDNMSTLTKEQKLFFKNMVANDRSLVAGSYRNQEESDALKTQGFYSTDTISAYGAEYLALVEQRRELESRIEAENNKKKTDKDKMSGYKEELSALNSQIREFKDTVLKEVLGLDFKSWADSLASNLVSAFQQGQDAAEAFTKSVNDILKTITQNAIKNAVIMPYLNKLKEQIEDVYDINQPDSIDKVVDLIYKSEDQAMQVISDAQKIWDSVNRRTNGALDSTSEGGNTISGTSKNITEETGSLIASYLNAMRADVSIKRSLLESLVNDGMPKVDTMMELQLRELRSIAQNTALIAANTEANVSAVKSIKETLGSVVTTGAGGKAVRIK